MNPMTSTPSRGDPPSRTPRRRGCRGVRRRGRKQEIIRTGIAMGADTGVLITGVEGVGSKESPRLSPRSSGHFPGRDSRGQAGRGQRQFADSGTGRGNPGHSHASCITRFELKDASAEVEREVEAAITGCPSRSPPCLRRRRASTRPLPDLAQYHESQARSHQGGVLAEAEYRCRPAGIRPRGAGICAFATDAATHHPPRRRRC